MNSEQQAVVKTAISILSRELSSPTSRKELGTPKDAVDYLRIIMGDRKVETYVILYLDARYRLIETQEINTGTIDQVSMHPRALLTTIANNCARYIILAHNHPSGDCTASSNDKFATEQLRKVVAPFDVEVLDHFVIGRAPGFPVWSITANQEVPW